MNHTRAGALKGAWRGASLVGLLAALVGAGPAAGAAPINDAITESLSASPGDATRGRAIVVNRQTGLCLLCHSGPFAEERFQGTLAPDLSGAGSRLTVPQLRLRMVDSRRINPQSIMPAYFRSEGLTRVGPQWQGRTLLSAQQVEDVVAYLATLR